jgi:hypothetical protein
MGMTILIFTDMLQWASIILLAQHMASIEGRDLEVESCKSGSERDKAIRGWRKLHHSEPHTSNLDLILNC